MTAAGNMVHCQLWMGGLEPYMTESFILASFQRMGEKPLSVKVMRNKFSGEPAGYCFVHFENDDEAIDAMHKLNGKIIPNTNPAVRFRLNTATNQGKIMMNDREFSLWVGDLSSEVDDYTLYKTFAAIYQSLKAAKVILDASGYSKGFGFLRFGLEEEQKHCLSHMNGYKGLGTKPLKISNAIPKTQRAPTANGQPAPQASSGYQYPADYSQYYDPNYWQNYGQWSGYGYDPSTGNYSYDPSSYTQYSSQYPGQYPTQYPASSQYPSQQNYAAYSHGASYSSYYPPQPASTTSTPAPVAGSGTVATAQSSVIPVTIASSVSTSVDDANSVVEHSLPVDVEKENREYSEAIINFWVDLALNCGLSQEVFEDEVSKLNIVEVSLPPIPAKLENRAHARLAIEAQDICDIGLLYDLSDSSSSDDDEDSASGEGSVEPVEKKRKMSDSTSDAPESVTFPLKSELANAENDEGDSEIKEKMEVVFSGENEQKGNIESVSQDPELKIGEGEVKTEAPFDSEFENKVDGMKQEEDSEKRKESAELRAQAVEKWKKMEGFMATVDVDVLMTETESVSSESTNNSDNSSDSDDSSDGEDDDKNDCIELAQSESLPTAAENGQLPTTENVEPPTAQSAEPPSVKIVKASSHEELRLAEGGDNATQPESQSEEPQKMDYTPTPCESIHNSDCAMKRSVDCEEVVNGSMEVDDN